MDIYVSVKSAVEASARLARLGAEPYSYDQILYVYNFGITQIAGGLDTSSTPKQDEALMLLLNDRYKAEYAAWR